jgi:hypothetical protein
MFIRCFSVASRRVRPPRSPSQHFGMMMTVHGTDGVAAATATKENDEMQIGELATLAKAARECLSHLEQQLTATATPRQAAAAALARTGATRTCSSSRRMPTW